MQLSPYLASVAADLTRVTALADDATRATAERLASALEPALRLALIQAVTDAAAQATASLDGAAVQVHLDGGEPVITVRQEAAPPPAAAPEEADPGVADEDQVRITVRLPESLKRRAEDLAAGEDLSLNTWIVRAVRGAAAPPGPAAPGTPRRRVTTHRITGWA